jgi:hypothetical protein
MNPALAETTSTGAAGKAATAFFESVREACRAAESRAGSTIRRYIIGGYAVEIRFAGDALLPHLAPALEHLAAPGRSGKADLTVCAWESESTNTPMPPRPWGSGDCIARGDIRGFGSERIDLALSADVGAVSLLDAEENLGLFWIRAAGHIPTYERGAPLRSILHWWMRRRGRLLIHAGAVGREGKGVLLVGRGGSGKSTAALTCMLNGWRYLSDDYCLLAAEGGPRAYSLYNTAKLTAGHLKHFPALQPAVSNPAELGGEKALIFTHRNMPERVISETPIDMILLPRVSGDTETRLRPASPTAALRALAPSSLFQIPGTGRLEFQTLAEFVQRVPCFHLALGTELDKIPDVLWKAFGQ